MTKICILTLSVICTALAAAAAARSDLVLPVIVDGCYPEVGCIPKSEIPFPSYPQAPAEIPTSFIIYNPHNVSEIVQRFWWNDRENFLGWLDCGPTGPSTIMGPQYTNLTFLIHGFTEDVTKKKFGSTTEREIVQLKNGLIEELDPKNLVIAVDWAKGAALPNYWQAAVNTRMIGRIIALLLRDMAARECIPLENIHLIGFSLGAHVAGYVGKDLNSWQNRTVGRITGLDPAGPLFAKYLPPLSPADADFVDVIHTSCGNMITAHVGLRARLGHVDFYPNGGVSQPMCQAWSHWLTPSCNHESAIEYYLASLNSASHNNCTLTGLYCRSNTELMTRRCAVNETQVPTSPMGYWVDWRARGKYYVPVTDQFPYCDSNYTVEIINDLIPPENDQVEKMAPILI